MALEQLPRSVDGQVRRLTEPRLSVRRSDLAGLADAVGARKALRQETDQERGWEADDVQIVALDALDQGRAEPLDRIPARAALPLTAAHVVSQVPGRQHPERDHRCLAVQLLPRARPQTEP